MRSYFLAPECGRPISTQRTNTLTVFLEKFSNLKVVFYNSLTSGELGIFSNMIWTSAFSMRCSLHVFLESYLSIPYWLTGALVIVWTLMVSFVFQIPCIIFFQYMYIFFELYGILCHIEIFNLYLFLFWFLLSLRLFCSNPPKLLILWFWNVNTLQFSSVQFSCSVVSDSLRPHES